MKNLLMTASDAHEYAPIYYAYRLSSPVGS